MKVLKRVAFWLLSVILIIAGTLLVIAFAYEKEVKQYMIQQLNGKLTTKVMVESKDIHFSLFRNFPYASLNFKNISVIESPIQQPGQNEKKILVQTDTLFKAENISLQFNLWNILTKNYIVKKISIENGSLKLKTGTDGEGNWDIWKKEDTTSASGGSVFKLQQFQLDNVALIYRNYKNNADISCLVHKASIGGAFTNREYALSVSGDLFMGHFKFDSINYVDNKPIKLDLNLNVNNEKKSYQFSDALVQISGLKIAVEGQYVNSSPSEYMDVSLDAKDMEIQSLLSILPEKYHKQISDYESDGEFYCRAHINGKLDKVNPPEIRVDFGINKADITQLSSGIVIRNVHLLGNYATSSEKNSFFIKSFSARLANGQVAGSVRMDDLASPFVAATVKGNLLLEDVRNLLKVDSIWNYPIQSLSGVVKIDMKYKGRIKKSDSYHKSDFENLDIAGDMTLENAGMKIKNSTLAFDSINGSFILNDNDIKINSFAGKTLKSDFYLKGLLKNIIAYTFSDNAPVNIEAIFQSNNFDLNEFLINQKASSKRDTVYKISFLPNLNFALNTDIGHLSFRKFEANDLKGTFSLHGQKLMADPVSFSTMDGKVSANGTIDGTKNGMLLITCNSDFNRLNISKLFYQFEDFDQSIITHDNLRGIGTASVQFTSVWKSDLTIDPNKISVRSNMTIEKGELLNFKPMNSLSKYISLSELQDIKFSTLQNEIGIKDRKIFISKTDIKSNALDVTLSGSHSFDNELDYHFKVLMSDILFQKARRAKKENDEFGIVEDDKDGKTSLFISMKGTVDKPIIKYDKLEAKQNLKKNIAEEKQTLKKIFKDEFKWHKRDTALTRRNKPKEDDKFIIKWEEDEKKKQVISDVYASYFY